jgi:hypothetical protein
MLPKTFGILNLFYWMEDVAYASNAGKEAVPQHGVRQNKFVPLSN